MLYILEPAAREKKLKVNRTGTHIYIEAVQQILGEVIYNLCDNAIKYNRTEGNLTVTVYEEDGRPAVSVSDTGIGIPREDLDRVFERFYRVNKSQSKEIGGTGLGLSIVKHGACLLYTSTAPQCPSPAPMVSTTIAAFVGGTWINSSPS